MAWRLLYEILPVPDGVATPTHTPKRRDWAPDPWVPATIPDLLTTGREIARRLVADVGSEGARWKKLLDRLSDLPPEQRDELADRLLTGDLAMFPPPDRLAVWTKVRSLIAKHREFPDAGWALPAAFLDRMESAYERLQPPGVILQYAWLFTWYPPMPTVRRSDTDKWDSEVRRLRTEAVKAVHEAGGYSFLLSLASKSELPFSVGYATAQSGVDISGGCEPLDELASNEQSRAAFARGYVRARYDTQPTWIDDVLADAQTRLLSDELRAEIYLCLDPGQAVWDRVDREADAVQVLYWRRVGLLSRPDGGDWRRPLAALLKHRRPGAVVELLSMWSQGESAFFDAQIATDALETLATVGPGEGVDLQMLVHSAAELLDALDAEANADVGKIAALEWRLLPLLCQRRTPRVLHRELARDPNLFTTVLSFVYRADGEDEQPASEERAFRATLGWKLLRSWRVVPGTQDDGVVNLDALREWVRAARQAAEADKRSAVADIHIGQVLAFARRGADGTWPDEPVRDLLEDLANDTIERGLAGQAVTNRGLIWKEAFEGGRQEEELARRYRQDADALAYRWPRTAALLRRIAEQYAREARGEDTRATLLEDLGC